MKLTVPIKVEFDEEQIKKVAKKYAEEHNLVEVVRCKNCKHRWVHTSISKKTETVIECTLWDKLTEFDGFCHNAEEGEGYE